MMATTSPLRPTSWPPGWCCALRTTWTTDATETSPLPRSQHPKPSIENLRCVKAWSHLPILRARRQCRCGLIYRDSVWGTSCAALTQVGSGPDSDVQPAKGLSSGTERNWGFPKSPHLAPCARCCTAPWPSSLRRRAICRQPPWNHRFYCVCVCVFFFSSLSLSISFQLFWFSHKAPSRMQGPRLFATFNSHTKPFCALSSKVSLHVHAGCLGRCRGGHLQLEAATGKRGAKGRRGYSGARCWLLFHIDTASTILKRPMPLVLEGQRRGASAPLCPGVCAGHLPCIRGLS